MGKIVYDQSIKKDLVELLNSGKSLKGLKKNVISFVMFLKIQKSKYKT